MPFRVTTYKDAFEGILGIKFGDVLQKFVKTLEKEGHTEKSIAFSIWKTQEKLLVYKGDSRFLAVLRNEVNKWSWKKDDPRWDDYWKKKNEEEKMQKYRNELKKYNNDPKNSPQLEKQAFNKKAQSGKGYVYFIQGLSGGAIKIGFSNDPQSRLKTLQTGYPDILRVLCLVPGNEKTEIFYHKKFELYKLSGEWFKPVKQIFDEIESLKTKYSQ